MRTLQDSSGLTRREALRTTTRVAAASALTGLSVPLVHAGETNTIQIALIGCGGRGTGAVGDALSTQAGPVKLVAMADCFEDRLESSFANLSKRYADHMEVNSDRKFVGLDAYKHAIDCLKPGDVAILATPPAFRWPHFAYAIEKGVHVFMEKPVTVDGPTTKRMLELGAESVRKNLKVGVGLMCRHCEAREQLYQRIMDGQIGEILLLRAYRMVGPTGSAATGPRPEGMSELEHQIRRFHAFLWASGGSFSDFLIHNIDECCWMKNAWPIKAQGSGGNFERGDRVDQNFDTYSVEYTFEDGSKLMLEGRNMEGCHQEFASYAHGTKGAAVISTSGHSPAKCRISKTQNFNRSDLTWSFPGREPSPYQREWDHLMAAIREDRPFNEVQRGCQASLVTSMGRMAAHTGQVVTYDDMLNCPHEFAPNVDRLSFDGPAPLVADETGKYPRPAPGIKRDREY